jgi:hypothetical protein
LSLTLHTETVVAARNRRGVVAAFFAAGGVWALGWGINFAVLDFSSPRGHAIVLFGTIVLSALVALLGVERALVRRTPRLRAWLTALSLGVLVAGLEFATWFALALHELSQLDGS